MFPGEPGMPTTGSGWAEMTWKKRESGGGTMGTWLRPGTCPGGIKRARITLNICQLEAKTLWLYPDGENSTTLSRIRWRGSDHSLANAQTPEDSDFADRFDFTLDKKTFFGH